MRGNEKILVVDDEPGFVDACCQTFGACCCDVLKATDRSTAEQMMDARPDVVVLGTLAPAGEAYALQQWIKRHPVHRGIPVVVVDAEHYDRRHKGWRELEGLYIESEEYVSKPIHPDALLPVIDSVLSLSRQPVAM